MTQAATAALLLLDLQRDFLAPDGRLRVAQDEVDGLLTRTNRLASIFVGDGGIVTYIVNEFSPWDFAANLFRRNAAIRGTLGAELDPRVRIVSPHRFSKHAGDAFSNPELSAFLHRHGVRDVFVAGVFAEACVSRTALGALRHGFQAHVVADAVAGVSPRAVEAALRRLKSRGIAMAATATVTVDRCGDNT